MRPFRFTLSHQNTRSSSSVPSIERVPSISPPRFCLTATMAPMKRMVVGIGRKQSNRTLAGRGAARKCSDVITTGILFTRTHRARIPLLAGQMHFGERLLSIPDLCSLGVSIGAFRTQHDHSSNQAYHYQSWRGTRTYFSSPRPHWAKASYLASNKEPADSQESWREAMDDSTQLQKSLADASVNCIVFICGLHRRSLPQHSRYKKLFRSASASEKRYRSDDSKNRQ
ncbi:hypothetical protein DFJ73DRAFT_2403 [Zopfochytrium polystomum]|nr:hypothetical protein DFJ73DRAFT_2403 [Zopfochytrium polystomum]